MVWSRQIASNSFAISQGSGIALDQQDNFYFASGFSTQFLAIGNQTLTNRGTYENGFIAKFSRTGDSQWVRQIGGDYGDWPIACVTDSQGDVFVTGVLGSTNVVLGDTVLTNSQQKFTESCFLVKYDPQGNVLWARQSFTTVVPNQGFTWDYGTSVAIDAAGDAWVAGTFDSSNIVFGTNLLVNPNYTDPTSATSYQDFLVKYSSAGDALWARMITVSTDNNFPTVGVDTNGAAFLCANFLASAVVGTVPVTNVFGNSSGVLLAKFDSAGNVRWAEQAAHPVSGAFIFPGPIAVDLQGNGWISGIGGAAFVSNTLPPTGTTSQTPFVAKFDASGNFLWAAVPTNQVSIGVSVDAIGNGYALDRYSISKYAADGTVLWTGNSLGLDGPVRVAADPAGVLFLVGENSPWGPYVAAELSGPTLNIQPSGSQVVISWPTNEAGLSLGTASSLSGPWSPVTNPVPVVIGNQYFVTNDVSAGSQFFRLGNF